MFRIIALVLAFSVGAAPGIAQDKKEDKKPTPKITLSKETTYILGPLDKHGYPDYEFALNERLSEGVTADNNAVVLLFKALGPRPEGGKMSDGFYKWLKIASPPEKGDYFLNPYRYGRDRLKDEKKAQEFWEKVDRVTSRPWSAKDHPDVAEWVKFNEKALVAVIEATKRTHYYHPLVSSRTDERHGLFACLIPAVQECRGLAQALTARAMLRVHEKKYDEAWQDLLACHRLGRLVGKGGTLIEGLVGVAIDSIACKADLAFLEAGNFETKKIKDCLRDLQALPPFPVMGDKIALAERFMFLESVTMVDRHGPGFLEGLSGKTSKESFIPKITPGTINWDGALRNGNVFYTRLASTMRLRDRTLRDKHMRDFETEIKELKVKTTSAGGLAKAFLAAKDAREATGKVIGDIMICLLMPAVMKVQHASDRMEQVNTNVQVAFALAAYKKDNGQYPAKLDAIAPKYLAEVPNDMFSGKALIYRTTDAGYVFYSVGANGKDEGGRSYGDEPSGDDLPVRMPR